MVKMSNANHDTESLWGFSASVGPVGIRASIPYRPGLLAEILQAEIIDPLTLLLHKALHTADFVGSPPPMPGRERAATRVTVDSLRQSLLKERKVPRRPQLLKVSGMFATAVLLNSGWWERSGPGGKPVGRNDIQKWTYAGFEEWGPSWDFTSAGSDDFFLGQLGEGDEANSILVAAVGARARRIKPGIVDAVRHGGAGAIAVDVTGLLCHRSHLAARNPELSGLASRWHADFNYCLLLDSDHHRITPVHETPDFYSAYLWQCWCATDQVPAGQVPTLNDCYLVWEHTDLTKPDAIKYNLDSLAHKYEYLRREYGNLVLLQKSGPLVPGTPRLPSKDFQGVLGKIGRMAR